VRSVRVFDVRTAPQRTAGENDDCRRHALVYLGTYGTQGDFSWAVSSPTVLPDAHVGLEGWGRIAQASLIGRYSWTGTTFRASMGPGR
jgi:hypothetical protein